MKAGFIVYLVAITCVNWVLARNEPILLTVNCDQNVISVVLNNVNMSQYKGVPYVKGYGHNKDCTRAFLTTDTNNIEFNLQFSKVMKDKGDSGLSSYAHVCGTLINSEQSHTQGSFSTTLILPVSEQLMESTGDHVELVTCSWGNLHKSNKAQSISVQSPVLRVDILGSKGQVITTTRLGDDIEVHISAEHMSQAGKWDILHVLSLVARNTNGKQSATWIQDGCLVGNNEVEELKVSYDQHNDHVARLKLKAFRFVSDPVLIFEANIEMCSSKEKYSASKCRPDCITKKQIGAWPSHKKSVSGHRHLSSTHFRTHLQSTILVVNPKLDNPKLLTGLEYSKEVNRKGNTEVGVAAVDPYVENIVLCLDQREVAITGVILFIVTVAVVLSTTTVLFYQVILHQRKQKLYDFKKDLLNDSSPFHTPGSRKTYNVHEESSNAIMYSWLSNRIITPPPTKTGLPGSPVRGAQLHFSRKITPLDVTPVDLVKARSMLNRSP